MENKQQKTKFGSGLHLLRSSEDSERSMEASSGNTVVKGDSAGPTTASCPTVIKNKKASLMVRCF